MTDFRGRDIYIVDLETTGLMGWPTDHILEVGIAKLDLDTGEIDEVYERVCNPGEWHLMRYRDKYGEPWIFKNGYMTQSEVKDVGLSLGTIMREVERILFSGEYVTSYNVAFDFDKFLLKNPFVIYDRGPIIPFDIADLATRTIKAKLCNYQEPQWLLAGWGKIPPVEQRILEGLCINPERRIRAIDAYCYLCPDDPLKLAGREAHRALKDALMEAHILRSVLMLDIDSNEWGQ